MPGIQNFKIIPNTSNIAYYNPFGQYIALNRIGKEEFEKATSDFFNISNLSTTKTFAHEIRHWKDHHTTLWGINSLIEIYNAVNARLLNNPDNFHYIVTFFKNAKKSNLTEYYHTKIQPFDVKSNDKFWKWNLTVGSRFDSNGNIDTSLPIPFVNFLNPLNNEVLSRTPLSNSSFLETNSIFEEIKILSEIYRRVDEGTLIVESKLMQAEYLDWLYNYEYTLYSASAHLISSVLDDNDILSSFRISNQISNLLLNLPESLYEKIPINSYLNEFGEKNNLLKSQNDNGFAFLNLILNYKDSQKGVVDFNIDDLLCASSLPCKSEIEQLIIEEFIFANTKVIDGPFAEVILAKIKNATNYFIKNKLNGALLPAFDFMEYEKPTIVLSDTLVDMDNSYNYEDLKKSLMRGNKLTNTGWYLMHQDIYNELETFYNICGI